MINDDTIDSEQLPMAIGFTRLTRDVVRATIVAVDEDGTREAIARIDYTLEQAAQVAQQLIRVMS